jgi:hypothetical protein
MMTPQSLTAAARPETVPARLSVKLPPAADLGAS